MPHIKQPFLWPCPSCRRVRSCPRLKASCAILMMDDWQHGAEAVGCKVFSKAKAEEFGVLAVRCVQGR